MASIKSGQVAEDLKALLQTPPPADALARITADPSFNSVLHTTCVATMIDGGHAPNALPQRAGANVNCRIFPGHSQEEIRKVLEQVVNDAAIAVSFAHAPEDSSAPPPLTREILTPIETVSEQMWPGLPVLPFMVAGGTDGRFLTPAGIPTYGVSGMFKDPAKVNAHGLNEKMPVASLYESQEFLDRLIRIYAGGE
jgi:acetylornithine deacetylase/succinyl-diaminopimelate desuccinylase-like protein